MLTGFPYNTRLNWITNRMMDDRLINKTTQLPWMPMMPGRIIDLWISLTILCLSLMPTGFAQTGQITGLITDPSGAGVPDARITATNVNTGIEKSVTTNEQGYYTIPLLNPGSYQLMVRRQGFKQIMRQGIHLEVAQTARIDFGLQVGDVVESVSVRAEAPLLRTESASVGQVIGNKKILDLPLNGRDFTQLATLSPGAIGRGSNASLESSNVSVNGARNSKTVFMIDGGIVSSQYFDGATIIPSVDAIQEFTVQSNAFAAEYGQGAAVINISLRSGTNEWHGSAFEFLRNEVLDARNFFNTTGVRPAVKQNQFGLTLGGPLTIPHVWSGKDRTFFFADYEGTRIRRAITFNTPVPSAAMRLGDFSELATPIFDPATTRPDPRRPGGFLRDPFPGNQIPRDRLSPQALFFLPFYPLPNTPAGTFNFVPSLRNTGDRSDGRVDHRFSDRDALAISYTFQRSETYTPGRFAENGAVALALRKQRVGVTHTHSLSSRTINELRLGYVRSRFLRTPQGLGTNYTVQSGIGGFEEHSREFPGFPGLSISNFLSFDVNAFVPIKFRDNKYEVIDNLTFIRGNHTFKTGLDLRRYSTNTTNAAWSRGFFTFTGTYSGHSFADFLLGLPFNGRRSFPRNAFGIDPLRNEHFFFQDDWKLTANLTLNLGLRYELNHPPKVLHNQAASTDPVLRRIVVASDRNGRINHSGQQVGVFLFPLFADVIVPSSQVGLDNTLRRLDKNNFAPRFGIAWRPWGSDWTLRAGYGIFYGLIQGNRAESTAIVNPPFLADELSNFNTQPVPTRDLSNMFAPVSQGLNLVPLTFFQIEAGARDPYFQQWNLTIQKVVAKVVSVEGAYVASKGSKIEFSRPINVPRPGPGPIQGRRLWTRFAAGTYVENSGYSSYHAFQGKLEIRSWRSLSMLASYAFSKSIDNLSGDTQGFQSQDPDNSKGEKGPSDFDIRHRFVLSFNYALPFGSSGRRGLLSSVVRGWEVGSILTLQSGFPFSPTISTDTANTGTSLRPDRIGKGTVEGRTLSRDFDPATFRVPAPFTYGNSGRNILYERAFKNWDFIVLRNFKLHERLALQFRAEFFNFTNTPRFGRPVTNIQSASVGKILSAGEPRDIQFALKLIF